MERMTLETLCGGAVQEKIDRAFQKVAENILDPNTEAKKKRVISMVITLAPNENDREDVAVDVEVRVKLAAELGIETQFFLSQDLSTGALSIAESQRGQIKGQLSFGFDPETGEIMSGEKVVDLYKKEA